MRFENTMCLLFSKKAYQIAGTEANPKHRRDWIQKAIREFIWLVNSLDTTPRHKKMLMLELDEISESLKKSANPTWDTVYRFLRLTMRLFGFDYMGARCHMPAFWQTSDQRQTTQIFEGRDPMYSYQEKKNAISIRRNIVETLKKKGLDDFKISLVLNTSEYAVKQLRSSSLTQQARRKRRRAN